MPILDQKISRRKSFEKTRTNFRLAYEEPAVQLIMILNCAISITSLVILLQWGSFALVQFQTTSGGTSASDYSEQMFVLSHITLASGGIFSTGALLCFLLLPAAHWFRIGGIEGGAIPAISIFGISVFAALIALPIVVTFFESNIVYPNSPFHWLKEFQSWWATIISISIGGLFVLIQFETGRRQQVADFRRQHLKGLQSFHGDFEKFVHLAEQLERNPTENANRIELIAHIRNLNRTIETMDRAPVALLACLTMTFVHLRVKPFYRDGMPEFALHQIAPVIRHEAQRNLDNLNNAMWYDRAVLRHLGNPEYTNDDFDRLLTGDPFYKPRPKAGESETIVPLKDG